MQYFRRATTRVQHRGAAEASPIRAHPAHNTTPTNLPPLAYLHGMHRWQAIKAVHCVSPTPITRRGHSRDGLVFCVAFFSALALFVSRRWVREISRLPQWHASGRMGAGSTHHMHARHTETHARMREPASQPASTRETATHGKKSVNDKRAACLGGLRLAARGSRLAASPRLRAGIRPNDTPRKEQRAVGRRKSPVSCTMGSEPAARVASSPNLVPSRQRGARK
jgi:hypothetical protein